MFFFAATSESLSLLQSTASVRLPVGNDFYVDFIFYFKKIAGTELVYDVAALGLYSLL